VAERIPKAAFGRSPGETNPEEEVVSEQRDEEGRFPDPPEGLLTYPTNRVGAQMDDPDGVAAAIEDLVQAGFEHSDIFVLAGPQGAERLDVTGRHHGLRGRMYRFVEHLGDEHEQLLAAAEHLKAGGLLIMVPADDDNKDTAARILKAHGGHQVLHFGKAHWESLGG
jgi:hypothetical protein